MGILNTIFRWFILDRNEQIDAFRRSPLEAQRKVLTDLVSSAAQTEWGKTHQYANIKDYNDYVKNVPLQDYNSIKPYVERTMQGEQNLLWSTPINWFAKSSGTTDDRSKFIPVSKESLQACHYKAGKDLYAIYYNMYPEANLIDGKSLVLGGSHQVHQLNENTSYGDLSAVLMQNLPIWAEAKRVPDLSIALMDNWEQKIELMAKATVNQDITNILGVPTWTVILIKRLFEMTGKNNLVDIWPNLQLYVHGGVSFTPYRDLFKDLIRSDKMHYLETYNASEGFFAIQDRLDEQDMLLMLDYGIYYEFIPADEMDSENPHVIPLEAVRTDVNYAVVISTNGGLWRYMVGDTVKFTSTDPYRIKVSGRTKHFINAFGEEVIIENAEKALAEACEKTNCLISDYTAAPVYFSSGGNGAHEWLIEFEQEPADIEMFTDILDSKLREVNSDYDAKRFKDIALGRPLVRRVVRGTFYNWMKKRGKLGGQHKVPRLANTRTFVDDILAFTTETEPA
ncbi:MAG: GH3 auxin-responsive promoter family protein [Sphingobacteriales bacterium]|nr:MAG: GH3 auxin-responsive promoter family protein [Sphingobacteriales bacterium]